MIRQSYDATVDALYLTLRDGDVAGTREIGSGTNVDLDAAGGLLGIEVLSPGRPWPLRRILAEYEISDEDAHVLMMVYPGSSMRGVG